MNWTALFFTLFFLGLVLLWFARRTRVRTGLPSGRVIAADVGEWQRLDRPLFSHKHQLTGRPDYILADGADLIPVEVKSGNAPDSPYRSHLLQLAAYCLLTSEMSGRDTPYGMIRYADQTFKIPYTSQLEEQLLETMVHMRDDLMDRDAHRNHNDPRRCAACGHRDHCDVALS
jgi:CRISPR-associated exonuclease Cas4